MSGEQNHICVRAKLLAKREGTYTMYIFENLDTSTYIMTTKCPNWCGQEVDLYQEGFLSYKFVEAGKDSWYCKNSMSYFAYQYTANYFLDFVPITHVLDNGFVIKKETLIIT